MLDRKIRILRLPYIIGKKKKKNVSSCDDCNTNDDVSSVHVLLSVACCCIVSSRSHDWLLNIVLLVKSKNIRKKRVL